MSDTLGSLAAEVLAAIGAMWSSNLVATRGSYARLPRVATTSLGAAIILALLVGVLQPNLSMFGVVRNINLYFLIALVLALVAAYSSSRLRQPRRSVLGDALMTFGLVGGAIAVVIAVVLTSALLGVAGA